MIVMQAVLHLLVILQGDEVVVFGNAGNKCPACGEYQFMLFAAEAANDCSSRVNKKAVAAVPQPPPTNNSFLRQKVDWGSRFS
jgi:hypothetical protein